MNLTDRITEFMDLYWKSDWEKMRTMVTEDFLWENRPSQDVLLSFDGLIEVSVAFIEGTRGWPGIEEGQSVHLRSVESGNQVAQERMDMWKSKGRWYKIPCCGFWTFNGNRIAAWNDYFDMAAVQAFKAGTLTADALQWAPPPQGAFAPPRRPSPRPASPGV